MFCLWKRKSLGEGIFTIPCTVTQVTKCQTSTVLTRDTTLGVCHIQMLALPVCTCLCRRICIGGERTTWAVTPQSLATLFGETGPPPGTCEGDEAGWPADPRTCLSPLPWCWDYKHTTMPGFFKVWILGIKVARQALYQLSFLPSPQSLKFKCVSPHLHNSSDFSDVSSGLGL